jgi:hypothetical protein
MKTIQQALREWIDASPNKTAANTLIECRAGTRTFYGWNLKPNDPHEKDFVWDSAQTKQEQ